MNLHPLPPPPDQAHQEWPWAGEIPPLPPTLPDGRAWPRITLVTPSYNQGQFIEATLRSVALQGYPNLEWLVYDAGSADESVAVIQRYADWMTAWVSEPDRGQSHALNKGFARATGEIMGWLNSDDLLLPGALAQFAEAFAAHPEALLVHGQAYFIGEAGQRLHYHPYAAAYDRKWMLEQCNLIPQPAAFFRRALWETGGIDEDLHYTMDWDLWLRLKSPAQAIYLPTPLALMRTYPQAKSRAGGRKMHAEVGRVIERHGGHGLPAEIVKDLTTQHWRAAAEAYERGQAAIGREELAYVLEYQPDWRAGSRTLARVIAEYGWEMARREGVATAAAVRFAETAADNLPQSVTDPRAVRRQALALLYEALAFRARGKRDRQQARRFAWQAMRQDARWLTNRGLWSLLLK
jgi:hypothetical protein